jgi:hypothetical protein
MTSCRLPLLTRTAAMMFALFSLAGCTTTYQTVLGKPTVERIVAQEVARATLPTSDDFIVWVVPAVLSAPSSREPEAAQSELRQGFRGFMIDLVSYTRDEGSNLLTASEAKKFLVVTPKCGMIPCPKKCCARCRPCP